MGRPTEKPMNTMLRVRIDDETIEKLDDCARKLNTTRSDVVRKSIHKLNDDLRNVK
jgi:predicted transcriptional regulator